MVKTATMHGQTLLAFANVFSWAIFYLCLQTCYSWSNSMLVYRHMSNCIFPCPWPKGMFLNWQFLSCAPSARSSSFDWLHIKRFTKGLTHSLDKQLAVLSPHQGDQTFLFRCSRLHFQCIERLSCAILYSTLKVRRSPCLSRSYLVKISHETSGHDINAIFISYNR